MLCTALFLHSDVILTFVRRYLSVINDDNDNDDEDDVRPLFSQHVRRYHSVLNHGSEDDTHH